MSTDPFGLIGQVLDGQFRVDQLAGEGGFSAVYRGRHLGLDEVIALKFLKLQAALGSDVVESLMRRFRDESRLLYRLSQGNLDIVRCMASGTTIAQSTGAIVPYMVLEWLEGRSLAAELIVRKTNRVGGRPMHEAMALMDTALDAVAYAHSQGVVHRDLNPGNFFLAQTRTGPRMKVLDFGVAKVVRDEVLALGPRAQTLAAIRIFSPAYAAPEQMDERLGVISPATDVWSLAVILMEVLFDRAVFEGEALGEFFQKVLDPNFPKTPRRLGMNVGDSVEQVFLRALAIEPRERYQDAGSFWAELRAAVSRDTGAATMMGSSNPFQTNDEPTRTLDVAERRAAALASRNSDPGATAAESPPRAISHDATLSAETAEEAQRAFTNLKGTMIMPSRPLPTGGTGTAPPPAQPAYQPPDQRGGGFGSTLAMASPLAQMQQQQALAHAQQHQQGAPYAQPQSPAFMQQTVMEHEGYQPQQQQPSGGYAPQNPQGYPQPQHDPSYPQEQPYAPANAFDPNATQPPAAAKSKTLLVALAVFFVVLLLGGLVVGILVHQSKGAATAASASASFSASSTMPTDNATAQPIPDPTVAATATTDNSRAATAAPTVTEAPVVVTPQNAATTTATNTVPVVTTTTTNRQKPADPNAFNPKAARSALDVPASIISACKDRSGKTGPGTAHVTFAADGTVSSVTIDRAPYAGTPEADCIASKLRRAKTTPFTSGTGTLDYAFSIAP